MLENELSTLHVDIQGVGNPVLEMVRSNIVRLCSNTPRFKPCHVFGQTMTADDCNRLYVQYQAELTHGRVAYPNVEFPERNLFEEEHIDAECVYKQDRLKIEKPKGSTTAHIDYVVSAALLIDALLTPSFSDLPVLTKSL